MTTTQRFSLSASVILFLVALYASYLLYLRLPLGSEAYWSRIRLTEGEVFQGFVEGLQLHDPKLAATLKVKSTDKFSFVIYDGLGNAFQMEEGQPLAIRGEREKVLNAITNACSARISEHSTTTDLQSICAVITSALNTY
ncbi:MAG TPA: hypothetical protein VEA59_01010 [Patescibacteria group bacterium]|nr:hypothetical protein [Patescibacteria group bacterium]